MKISKNKLQKYINIARKEAIHPDNVNDIQEIVIDILFEDLNSAADIWMSDRNKLKLYKLIIAGKNIKSIVASTENDREIDRFNIKIRDWKKKGWKIFEIEDNIDQSEAILYK